MPAPNSNNSTDPVAHMEDFLLSQVETPEKAAFLAASTKEIQHVLKKLSAKTPRFRSSGICRLGITTDGQEEELLLPIRSVPLETMSTLLEEAYVEPPRSKRMNVETMEYEMVKDEHDPAYQRKIQHANVQFLKRFALYALDCELEDEDGTIVWNPETGLRNEAAALRVLEAQGLTQTHYAQIRTEVEELSMTERQRAEAARLKKR